MIDINYVTEEEAGEYYIDEHMVDMARQVLMEDNGTPEVLYDDPSPELYDDQDCESDLNTLIEVQERMARGMSIIKGMTARRDRALDEYVLAKFRFNTWMTRLERGEQRWNTLPAAEKTEKQRVYKQWKQGIWAKANPIRKQRNAAWEAYESHKEYLATHKMANYLDRLWTHWFELKDECCLLADNAEAGKGKVWYEYFELVGDEDYLQFTGFDCEEIDNLEILFSETEHMACIRDEHFKDEFAAPSHYDNHKPTTDIPVRSGGYVPRVKDVTHQYKAESDLVAEWAELDNQLYKETRTPHNTPQSNENYSSPL